MIEKFGNMWVYLDEYKDQIDAICCTTNKVVKKNGELVMGAGIAKDFANEYSWLPKYFGQRLLNGNHVNGFMTVLLKSKLHLIALPTKEHWQDDSSISLITDSINTLKLVTTVMGWKRVILPRPGCKNGGLSWNDEIKPLCETILNDDRF